MRPMSIYIADIMFDDSIQSKRRPALVVDIYEKYVVVFKITSKYKNKSDNIKQIYYPIKYWKKAGLVKKSYVDVHKTYKVTRGVVFNHPPMGKLELVDVDDLYTFLKNIKKRNK
ncbi:hypothetical protein BTM29_03420 [Companilactobacillus allii]|uniref:Toxin MazF n=1 Tax=Companilactobacillus allii TaxID=1847728 RepID=A0A1P8Q630_9LACO|nr:hypothetical protein BTM29_03420 [Companilactobacillus allii]